MTLKEEYRNLLDRISREFAEITEKHGEWSSDYTLWCTEYESWVVDDMLYIVSEYGTLSGDVRCALLADIEDWLSYNVAVAEFGIQYINLKSWLMGAPRLSDKELNRLRALKMDLYHEIEERKREYGGQGDSSQPEHLANIYKPY